MISFVEALVVSLADHSKLLTQLECISNITVVDLTIFNQTVMGSSPVMSPFDNESLGDLKRRL